MVMVLILDGHSEMGTHVQSKTGNFIYLRHFFRSKAVTNLIIFQEKELFLLNVRNACILSYHRVSWYEKPDNNSIIIVCTTFEHYIPF